MSISKRQSVETEPALHSDDQPPEFEFGFLRDDVGFQIHQARRAVRKALRGRHAEEDQPPGGSLTTLILIGLNPGTSQNEIAEAAHLDSSKVASLVSELRRRRWVEKRRSPVDGRRQDLFLTPDGERVVEDIRRESDARMQHLAGGLTARERGQLIRLLVKLQATIA